MIRSLRRRHLWMIVVIAVVVLVLFFAALASRPEPPIQDTFPEAAVSSSASRGPRASGRYPAVLAKALRPAGALRPDLPATLPRVFTRAISSAGLSEHGATAPRAGSPALRIGPASDGGNSEWPMSRTVL